MSLMTVAEMSIAEIMTQGAQALSPHHSVAHAARTMEVLDIGTVVVCSGANLVGIVTDRDIALRAVAQGLPCEETPLMRIMSRPVQCCHLEQSVGEALRLMREYRIRRIPVVDAERRLLGMLSLGDIAAKTNDARLTPTLQEICDPAHESSY